MLSRKNRIGRAEFKDLKKGVIFRSSHFILTVYKGVSGAHPQCAFSISKKIARNATDRNKVRRRGYEAVHAYINNIEPSILHFIAQRGVKDLAFVEFKQEIEVLLKRSGLFHPRNTD